MLIIIITNLLFTFWLRLNDRPQPVSKANHSSEEAHFCHLCPQSHSFSYYQELVTVGEGQDID